jgi:hypothetical protein
MTFTSSCQTEDEYYHCTVIYWSQQTQKPLKCFEASSIRSDSSFILHYFIFLGFIIVYSSQSNNTITYLKTCLVYLKYPQHSPVRKRHKDELRLLNNGEILDTSMKSCIEYKWLLPALVRLIKIDWFFFQMSNSTTGGPFKIVNLFLTEHQQAIDLLQIPDSTYAIRALHSIYFVYFGTNVINVKLYIQGTTQGYLYVKHTKCI